MPVKGKGSCSPHLPFFPSLLLWWRGEKQVSQGEVSEGAGGAEETAHPDWRQVTGPPVSLHFLPSGTYLKRDKALWQVPTMWSEAMGVTHRVIL